MRLKGAAAGKSVSRVCFPFVGDTVGGSHVSALLLAANLDRQRFEPVIVVHEGGALARHLDETGVQSCAMPVPAYLHGGISIWEYAAALSRTTPIVARFLRGERIDLVHGNDLRTNQTWAGASYLTGVPLIWHQRAKFAPSRLTRAAMRTASRILCNSEFCRKSMPARYQEDSRVIVNPFDTSVPPPSRTEARMAVLEAAGQRDADYIVGYCGTLSWQKRPNIFLEAAARIRSHLEGDVLFAIMGPDRDGLEAELRNRCGELGIAEDTAFLGFRHPATFWIAGFDVLLAPEFDDAYGRTLVEAMLAKTPVVASHTGGHLEVVKNREIGVLVACDDPDAMATAAIALLAHPENARAMAELAHTYASRSHGVEPHVRAVQAEYEAVLRH